MTAINRVNKTELSISLLAYTSILSWISFCETMLDTEKKPFTPISYRTIDAMLKHITFENEEDDISADKLINIVCEANSSWENEESFFYNELSNSQDDPNKLLIKGISHLLNHQDSQEPSIQIYTNFMRLQYILDCVIPSHQFELLQDNRYKIDIKKQIEEFFKTGIINICRSIIDLLANISAMYKETDMYQWYRTCKTEEDLIDVSKSIISGIANHTMGTAQFICDISRLLNETGSAQNTANFLNNLTIPSIEYHEMIESQFNYAKEGIPELAQTSYRYESILRKKPILRLNNELLIVPNYYEFFACIKELPFRFSEYFGEKSKQILDSIGFVYEFYVLELLKFTLSTDRFIVIPELMYKRGTEVRGPDFTVIDKLKHRIIVIELKSGRISNFIRDDCRHTKFTKFAEGITECLKDILVNKIKEIFLFKGDYSIYKNEITKCDMNITNILFVQKDIGILFEPTYHDYLSNINPELSSKLSSHHYCLLNLEHFETMLYNFNTSGVDIYETINTQHNKMVGKKNNDYPIDMSIHKQHEIKDTIYYHFLKIQEKESSKT